MATSIVAAIGGSHDAAGSGGDGGARRALVGCLKRVPSLIVLDNLESVLDPNGKGEPELEELLVLLATTGHRSTVVITTRVRPSCLAPHTGVHRPARMLPLDGLTPDNARSLIDTVAPLEGSDAAWEELLERLAGHPLALQLTALHVLEAYDASVDRYLDANAPRDDGVEQLIRWHLDRLRPAELDLLFRIAVHFNGVDAEGLAAEILEPRTDELVSETLRSLAARLPLERTARGVRLQAFIRDYSTQRLCRSVAIELRAGKTELLHRHPLHHPVGDDRAGAAQWRDLVEGVIEDLRRDRSPQEVEGLLRDAFEWLPVDSDGYAAGNLINLLGAACDRISHLHVPALVLRNVDFRRLRLRRCSFDGTSFVACCFLEPATSVYALAWSKPGDFLVAGDAAGTMRILRSGDFKPIGRLRAHSDWLRAVAVSEGGTIASGGDDCAVRLWERPAGDSDWTQRSEYVGQSWMRAVTFSGDAGLVACGDDGVVHLLAEDGSLVCPPIDAHRGAIRCVCALRNGDFVTVGDDGFVHRWSRTEHGAAPEQLAVVQGRALSAAVTRDESRVAVGTASGEIIIVPLGRKGARQRLEGASSAIRAIAWASDDSLLIAGTDDGAILAWESSRWLRLPAIARRAARVTALTGHPVLPMVAAATDDGTMQVEHFDVELSTRVMSAFSNRVWTVAVDSEESRFYLGCEDGNIYAGSPTSTPEPLLEAHAGRVWRLLALDGGRRLVSCGEDGRVNIWDPLSGERLHTEPAHSDWVLDLDWNESRQTLLTCSNDGSFRLWRLDGGIEPLHSVAREARVSSVRFRPGTTEMVAVSGSDLLCASSEDGEVTRSRSFEGKTLWRLAVDPRGETIAVGCGDGSVMLLDAETLATRSVFAAVDDWVRCLMFDRTGSVLLAAGGREQRCLCGYDVVLGSVAWTAPAEEGRIRGLALLPGSNGFCYSGDKGVLTSRRFEGWSLDAAASISSPYGESTMRQVKGIDEVEQAGLARLGLSTLE